MNRQQHTIKPTARFRRWTRKGYAMFSSLGRCVTIGQLRKNVTERALGKQSGNRYIAIQKKEFYLTGDVSEAYQTIVPADDMWITQVLLLLPQTKTQLAGSHAAESKGSVVYSLIINNEEVVPPRNGEEQPLPHLIYPI